MELQQPIADSPYGYPDWRSVPYVGERRGAGQDEDALGRFGPRLAARVLDIGVLVVAVVFLASGLTDFAGDVLPALLALVVVGGYEPVLTAVYGATPGKRLCGLRVVRRGDGSGLGFGRALWRWTCVLVGCAVPVLGVVNVLRCAWGRPYRQCLHDKAADTVVRRAQR
ncbi:RDD family protein [Streptomyces yatensis]|uniref:RDD domain-containing protein n=1 Tax=Streptomyces yatensis TaxID=155177 RepID=A0ABP4UY72_9ACTN|nr:RDD family protein [Streptomyces yatensis]